MCNKQQESNASVLFPGKGKHAHLLSIFNKNVFKNFPVHRIAYTINSQWSAATRISMRQNSIKERYEYHP